MTGLAYRGEKVSFGEYALQATGCGRMTARQIEAARIAMTRYTKRQGKVWIRVFPDKPISKKPAETRMGKGKSGPDHWVASLSLVAYCMRWMVCQKMSRVKHSVLQATNFLFQPSSSKDVQY